LMSHLKPLFGLPPTYENTWTEKPKGISQLPPSQLGIFGCCLSPLGVYFSK